MTRRGKDGSRFDQLARLRKNRADAGERGAEASPEPKPARETGRRSDQSYLQTTVYLPRDLHKAVKVALIQDEREFSALVESLLSEWLKTRKG
jgi:hypothetical protein